MRSLLVSEVVATPAGREPRAQVGSASADRRSAIQACRGPRLPRAPGRESLGELKRADPCTTQAL
eukprot:7405225-Pyramimonas_sp.AAC.1